MYLYLGFYRLQDRKEVPTATPTPIFTGSGNSVVLSGRFDVETGSEKFKMAAAKPDVPVS